MTRIYISDAGDDRNDGLTRETAIYSWQQAVKLCDGNTETNEYPVLVAGWLGRRDSNCPVGREWFSEEAVGGCGDDGDGWGWSPGRSGIRGPGKRKRKLKGLLRADPRGQHSHYGRQCLG